MCDVLFSRSPAAFQRAGLETSVPFHWVPLRGGGSSCASVRVSKAGLFAAMGSTLTEHAFTCNLFIRFWIFLKEVNTCS